MDPRTFDAFIDVLSAALVVFLFSLFVLESFRYGKREILSNLCATDDALERDEYFGLSTTARAGYIVWYGNIVTKIMLACALCGFGWGAAFFGNAFEHLLMLF